LYLANSDTGTVSVVDLSTGEPMSLTGSPLSLTLSTSATTLRIRDLALSSDGARLFAVMVQDNAGYLRAVQITSTSITLDSSVSELNLGGTPEQMAISADGSLAYVLLSDSLALLEINLTTFSIQETISLDRADATGEAPTGLALTDGAFPVYVMDQGTNSLVRITRDENGVEILTALALPRGGFSVALQTTTNRAFIPDPASGNVTIVDVAAFAVDETALPPLNPGGLPRAVVIGATTLDRGEGAFTPGLIVDREGRLFLFNADTLALVDVDTSTTEVDGVAVGLFPEEAVFSSDALQAYVTNSQSDSVSVVDLVGLAVSSTLD
jgi:DNA-binding beta-propeller fold protein YncE